MKTGGRGGRFRSLFSFGAFHFIDDGFADSLYLLLPFIAAELSLSYSQVGLLKGVFSGTMGLLQVPMSLLGERIGELTVVGFGILGLTGGFVLLSQASTFSTVLFSLVIAKGTGAGQHGLSSSVLSRVFEVSGRRAAMGTYNFSGDAGKVCIPFLLAVLINLWGWRKAVLALASAGFAVGMVLWALARQKEASPAVVASGRVETVKGWGIEDRKGFFSLLAVGIIDLMTRTALLTFLPFLFLQKGIPVSKIGYALTLLFAGGAFGKFVCGVLAEWLGVVRMVVGTEILTVFGILGLTWSPASTIWLMLPLVGIVLNGTSSVLYATVAELISPETRSRGYGLYYGITFVCGALSPVLYGVLTDAMGLPFSITVTALMLLATLPLTRHLEKK